MKGASIICKVKNRYYQKNTNYAHNVTCALKISNTKHSIHFLRDKSIFDDILCKRNQ